MRYQERIYPQTNVSALRNRDINIFNMSTDICVFNAPSYYVSGATILDCTVLSAITTSGYSHIITGETQTIPLNFVFTSNTESFTTNNSVFKFNIYSYDEKTGNFIGIPTFSSEDINYSAFTNSATTQYIQSSGLTLDGEYMIKGFFKYPSCLFTAKELNLYVDTSSYVYGDKYGFYNSNFDYYFAAITPAAIPTFSYDSSNDASIGTLYQYTTPINYYTIYPDIDQLENATEDEIEEFANNFIDKDYTLLGLPTEANNSPIITVNGLVLAEGLDYVYSGDSVIKLFEPLIDDDVVTIIYTIKDSRPLINDIIEVNDIIPSGTTDGQGNYSIFYNTDTNKYELYTSVTPLNFSDVIVMVNGVVLANGVDFYQSISNSKRIILTGSIILDDIITISYFPNTSVVNNVSVSTPSASWFITPSPQKVNGYFTLQLAEDIDFNTIVYSATTQYFINASNYTLSFPLSGYNAGDRLFYRVKKDKNYETICGAIINTYAYSETIPITISTNSINSY
jgi:hypothetical protein